MKIIDRYLTGEIITSVIWSVGVISLMLVIGNAMRELLTVLMSHQSPLSYAFSIFGYLL